MDWAQVQRSIEKARAKCESEQRVRKQKKGEKPLECSDCDQLLGLENYSKEEIKMKDSSHYRLCVD